jgi:hypothetical protein
MATQVRSYPGRQGLHLDLWSREYLERIRLGLPPMRYDGMRQQWHRFLAGDAMPVRVGSDLQAGFSGMFLEALRTNVGYATGTQQHEIRQWPGEDSELTYACLVVFPPLSAPAPQVGAATPGPGVPGPPPFPAPSLPPIPPTPSNRASRIEPSVHLMLRRGAAARFLQRACRSDKRVRS